MEIASSSNPPVERDGNGNCSSSASNGPPPHPNPRSNENNNPYPTTFVQADTATFKQVVQMLTGSSSKTGGGGGGIPPIRSTGQKKQGFKLYERRSNLKNGLMIDTPGPGFTPRKPELLSPSILDFPSLALSPANDTLLGKPEDAGGKKFYFHPSPRTGGEPQLLSLFPVTSPRVSGSS